MGHLEGNEEREIREDTHNLPLREGSDPSGKWGQKGYAWPEKLGLVFGSWIRTVDEKKKEDRGRR